MNVLDVTATARDLANLFPKGNITGASICYRQELEGGHLARPNFPQKPTS